MKNFKTVNLDKLGITASTACAIHCALLPFVFTLLPLWGLEFLATPALEISMIVLSLFIGIWSLSKSYRKIHHNQYPIIMLALGFAAIIFGHFSGIEILEPIMIPLGGFTIAGAHFFNLKLVKTCKHSH
ncbi:MULTISPECIES: MerC domain-containing protein [Pedobacter]|uniref:MerC domain-containing protein n=1 Tax=Pedobacter TaxID=84567 RepID=UPI00122BBDBA|nr:MULTISPECIES: MerC domain-containing protein [Pedobacter]RZL66148.1 MAG: MerC domain-containing protein [Pedobacter sp.]